MSSPGRSFHYQRPFLFFGEMPLIREIRPADQPPDQRFVPGGGRSLRAAVHKVGQEIIPCGTAAYKILEIIKKHDLPKNIKKKFFDINFSI